MLRLLWKQRRQPLITWTAARFSSTAAAPERRRRRSRSAAGMRSLRKAEERSEWWVVDGEMHEIGENVAPRERFVIPRDNLPNRRRKQMREQFMRRTRLVLKESEHEPWCKRYIELYQELRENWERLYWDEGYSKKLAQDHANYESAEDDDLDFSPYRRRRPYAEQVKDQGFAATQQGDTWEKIGQIRDKFEYDRERRMREKAFAPMNSGTGFDFPDRFSRAQPFDAKKYFPPSERE
ncbi:hypothetical protein Syun_010161 [Stephania yunnanensis]|uniref:Uncharacterized protein n=1 Tax=Stephania yunnanensis TaxID=152371 RepID=A0AAP0PPR2_9MAGN